MNFQMEEKELHKDIRRVIRAIFGQTHPEFYWSNEERTLRARQAINVPMLGDHFVAAVESLFLSHFTDVELHTSFHDESRCYQHATAFACCQEAEEI